MKTCTKCRVEKPLVEFHKHKRGKGGLRSQCKACGAAYDAAAYAANPEKFRARDAAAYAADPEKFLARSRPRTKAWQKANPEKVNAHNAKRAATKLQAIPTWADQGKIRFVYAQASLTGDHVDHVVPLKSKVVCGLHCEFNLQLLPPIENMSKGNYRWPDMPT